MRFKRIDSLQKWIAFGAVIICTFTISSIALAGCSFNDPAANMGTTEINSNGKGGTGTGGTGGIAEDTGTSEKEAAESSGTGMGGTGVRLGVYETEMQAAGSVTSIQGIAEVKSNGRTRQLVKGDPVCAGETITTSKSASVQIKLSDDGLIEVRPQTQLKIEKFAYSGTSKDKSSIRLHRGSCRIFTGKMGKSSQRNITVTTTSATISVREADHEVTVILPGDMRGYAAGTYDQVYKGTVLVRTSKGEIEIFQNQTGFAAETGDLPTRLSETPVFNNTDLQ